MSKKPGPKLANKGKKPPAVQPPDEATALGENFAETARRLRDLCDEHDLPMDCGVLEAVIRDCIAMLLQTTKHSDAIVRVKAHGLQQVAIERCVNMLRETIKLGGGDAKTAILTLLNATNRGCDNLEEATKDKKSSEALRAIASGQLKWPWKHSRKESSHNDAVKYFDEIGLGVGAIPHPDTKINPNAPWTKRALTLKEDIEWKQEMLTHERKIKLEADWPATEAMIKDAEKLTGIFRLSERLNVSVKTCAECWLVAKKMSGSPNPQSYTAMLVEAGKWRQVSDLPPLSEKTWTDWWGVAKEILEAYWEAHPAERDEDFKLVAGNQTIQGEINQAIREKLIHDAAVDAVQRAFKALAATVELPDNDRPANSLPPSADSIP